MIINGQSLLAAAPIDDMVPAKVKKHGVSHGLSEVGYDIRIKQRVKWEPPNPFRAMQLYERRSDHIAAYGEEVFLEKFEKAFFGFTLVNDQDNCTITTKIGRTAIASSVEPFNIPDHLWCEFRNKSTRARCFVDTTIGTDGEPGWQGHLTIEIIFHDNEPLVIPAGSGILKAVFHELKHPARYEGKYQNQPNRPVPAIFEGR